MIDYIYLACSLLPIFLPMLFLILLKFPAKKGMFLTFIIVFLSALIIWDIAFATLIAIIFEGINKSLTIILILVGAVTLLNVLKVSGSIERINLGFIGLSRDMRVQLVLLAYLFSALLEGISGFGAPVAVVGALLISLGFPPLPTAIALVIGNTVPTQFGAVGTPLLVGMSDVIDAGLDPILLTKEIVFLDLFVGTFIPFAMITTFILMSKVNNKLKNIVQIAPFTIIIGLLYQLVAILVANILGPELISIVTPIITMIFAILFIKFNISVPKNIPDCFIISSTENNINMTLFKAWMPYISVILILLLTRVVKPVKNFLSHIYIDLFGFITNNILRVNGLKTKLDLFYNPGFIILLVAITTMMVYQFDSKEKKKVYIETKKIVFNVSITILFTLSMVQIFIRSNMNDSNLSSMPVFLSSNLTFLGANWSLVSGFIGELGSFVSGSSTTSNITFSTVQYQIANEVGVDPYKILAAQSIGAGLGHMISINVIVSACAVTGLSGREGEVLTKGFINAMIFSIILSIIIYFSVI